jgi:hypothetical protein
MAIDGHADGKLQQVKLKSTNYLSIHGVSRAGKGRIKSSIISLKLLIAK